MFMDFIVYSIASEIIEIEDLMSSKNLIVLLTCMNSSLNSCLELVALSKDAPIKAFT